MKNIFESGYFGNYSVQELNSARREIFSGLYESAKTVPTVFISHKHDDLEDLKGIIGFLEKNYGVKAYIDSQDPSMPKKTSSKTADNIKKRIKSCDKFILLATNGAIESKWCNWELGFGDADKFPNNIALFPIKPKSTNDSQYKGTEYMDLYPYIVYCDGTEKYTNGSNVKEGYYVYSVKENGNEIMPLSNWLKKGEK